MIAVPAAKKYRHNSIDWGGICWHASINRLILVPRLQYLGTNDRPLFTLDPDTGALGTLGVSLAGMDASYFNTSIESLSLVSGTWRGAYIYNPPYRITGVGNGRYAVFMWSRDLDGSGSDRLFLYNTCRLGVADRERSGHHQAFVADNRGYLILWRDDWRINDGSDPVNILSPNDGSYTIITDFARPLDLDQGDHHLVMATSDGAISWYDVNNWSATAGSRPYCSFVKGFQAFECLSSPLQDLTIDQANGYLWALTKSGDVLRYDLETYNDTPKPNTPRALVAMNPPNSLPYNGTGYLAYQILDMWGIRSTATASVEITATATTEAGQFYGSLNGGTNRVTINAASGLVNATYKTTLPGAPTAGPETVIARVVS